MNILLKTSILTLLIIIFSCEEESPKILKSNLSDIVDTMTFSQYVLEIDKNAGDWVAVYQVTDNKYFRLIEHKAIIYKEDAICLLQDSSYNLSQKLISVYSMQKLPFEEYLDFVKTAVRLFREGSISERIMNEVICCQYPPNYQIIKNYHNQEVIDILNDLKKCHNISNIMDIDKMLSGEIWNDLSVFANKYKVGEKSYSKLSNDKIINLSDTVKTILLYSVNNMTDEIIAKIEVQVVVRKEKIINATAKLLDNNMDSINNVKKLVLSIKNDFLILQVRLNEELTPPQNKGKWVGDVSASIFLGLNEDGNIKSFTFNDSLKYSDLRFGGDFLEQAQGVFKNKSLKPIL